MQVKTRTLEEKYALLERRIKDELVSALTSGTMSAGESLAFLKIFSQAENYWELRLFISVFEEQFDFLKKIDGTVREIQKSELELFLATKMPELLKTDPDKMVEISKFAAKPEVTLVELFEKYKELKQ